MKLGGIRKDFDQWQSRFFSKIACMTKLLLIILVVLLPSIVAGHDDVGFPFGRVTSAELAITAYQPDTSAAAYVISEFGRTHVSYDDPSKLIYEYHTRIKILKQTALSLADVEIPTYKQDGREEIGYKIFSRLDQIQNTDLLLRKK